MATCPKGHASNSDDYCDTCGARINGVAVETAPRPAAEVATCPLCGTRQNGRFCEVDGYDFVAATLSEECPTGSFVAAALTGDAPTLPTLALEPEPTPPTPAPAGPDRAAGTGDWYAVVASDRAYYQRVRDEAGPDVDTVEFPAFCPERRFPLVGSQLLVGRRSRSRGIDPAIDLTGPPQDPGISHSHALLLYRPDSGWVVVDLDSANGTYLNGSVEPIVANKPVPLSDGDRIHLGAWTTLTVRTK